MKRRILYLIPHLQNQGPVMQLYALVSNIDVEQYDLIIATFFPERTNSMLKQFLKLGITVECGENSKWNVYSQIQTVKRVIEKYDPSIIHSCSTVTDCICASISCRKPLVITLHNNVYEDVRVQYGFLIGSFLCKKEMKAIQKADRVVPCSRTLYEQYTSLVPRTYDPIPNGIEISKWRMDSFVSSDILREKLNLPKDKFIFLSTGALIERKRPLTVIEAFCNVKLDNAILLILGDGDLSSRCKQYANQNVIFAGRVSNVKEYLYAADVFISASCAEGLPYAILEAECTGIRMLLSDIPQHREAINRNIDEVGFFPVDDSMELERLMKCEINNGKGRLEYDLEEISAEYMSERYLNVYNDILHLSE